MNDFAAAGLGLQQRTVRFVHADEGWATIARDLAAEIVPVVAGAEAEHIGSTAVPALLAKPIIDLAGAVRPESGLEEVAEPTSRLDGSIEAMRVMTVSPGSSSWRTHPCRVAFAHVVDTLGGSQWIRYLRFRDPLRRSGAARGTYAEAKRRLAEQHPDGRHHYTAGKALAGSVCSRLTRARRWRRRHGRRPRPAVRR